jgi:hypothetical protein
MERILEGTLQGLLVKNVSDPISNPPNAPREERLLPTLEGAPPRRKQGKL